MYLGDYRLGDTIDHKFTTRQVSGAPFTLAGVPVISAYPGNSTTELTAGITLTVDFDSRTGLNHVRVVATSGNGYATATDYQLVITTGTVNSVSVVSEVVATFSIEKRSALMPATAGRTLVVDAAGLADANAVKVGPTGSGTAQTTGDIFARIGAPAGASIAADIAAAKVDTAAVKVQTDKLTFTVANKLDSNVYTWNGTAVSAPATAGIPEVNVKNINNVSAAAVTVVKAVQGLTTADTIITVSGNVNGNVGGNVTGSVGSVATGGISSASFAAGAIDAAAIAANAIGASEIADGAIDAPTFAAGAINASAIAADAITASKIADAAIDAATFAAGAINAAAIAADAITAGKIADGAIDAATFAAGAITAAALAADAVDKIIDETIGDSTLTVRQVLRVVVAVLAGKLSGAATTTVTVRNVADDANVVVATVDADGNRSAVTVSP